MRAKKRKPAKEPPKKPPPIMSKPNVFRDIKPDAKPCSVCLELAKQGAIQPRAVMPLPPAPARSRQDNRPCCRDCQATETAMAIWGIHPDFAAARLCVANERCESLSMPKGMAELFGMCKEGVVASASLEDLDRHCEWLKRNGIPEHAGLEADWSD